MVNQAVRIAQSRASDAAQAVREFYAAVSQPEMELVIFFCSSEYDLEVVAAEMNHLFGGVQVVGCTTAGEIGPAGYLEHSFAGASLAADSFVAVNGRLEHLSEFEIAHGYDFAQTLLQRLESKASNLHAENSFAMLMIDGLSVREEQVAYSLQDGLGKIMLFGGSAGDDRKYSKTHVFNDGHFHLDSAVLLLVNTVLPFQIFMTQHFVSTEQRLVVTEADPARRIVKELNGRPAAEEYARLLGVDVKELSRTRFADSPVVVVIGGTDYVRSIQKANPDGSLTFFCAIEEGVVLRMAHGTGLVHNLEQTFDKLQADIGSLQLVLGCDCILRNQELSQEGLKESVGEIFRHNNTIAFSSYGEQFHGVHVNQTFTGIAIGTHEESQDD
jgi:hypothetical protein